jgi:putative protease
VRNYYEEVSVVECEIQAMELHEGDECIILSKENGVIRFTVEQMRNEEVPITHAVQKEFITFKVPEAVKRGEKLYKIVPAKTKHTS